MYIVCRAFVDKIYNIVSSLHGICGVIFLRGYLIEFFKAI
jgi:succinate dehydrogenase/fumarate reductase cytochrome b subunit